MIAVLVLAAPGADVSEVVRLAEEFSPRVEVGSGGASGGAASVALDASGVSRLFGGAEGLARELARQAEARGLAVRVAVAATRTAATLAAQQIESRPAVVRAGSSLWPGARSLAPVVIPPGREREALAALPLAALAGIADLIGPALEKAAAGAPKQRRRKQGRNYRLAPAPNLHINKSTDQQIDRLARWGLKTLGDLAALPSSELRARLGDVGLVLQRAASGQDERPLVPSTPPASFLQSLTLEWPVEDLQPLAFVIARLCDALEQALVRADRGAIAVTTMLRLVTKSAHARTLTLPAPMRDARVLRTLVMLDLESHPPGAAVDEVMIDVDVAPGRILQTGLFEPALPAPEALSTLVARLGALAGTARVGAPVLVDTHAPGAFAMAAFAPHDIRPGARGHRPEARAANDNAFAAFNESPRAVVPEGSGPRPLASGLWPDHLPAIIRRFRPPRAARVKTGERGPARVDAGDIRGDVTMAAGPWRTSGGWWRRGAADSSSVWDHDEWDVALDTGVICRLAQDRVTKAWVIDGVLD